MMLTLHALRVLVTTAMALRVMPCRDLAERRLQAPRGARLDPARAAVIARALNRAARIVRPTCLTRALAGAHLLAREGLAARVTIGVASGGAGPRAFAAHAWLAHGGLALSGQHPGRAYAPLCSVDAAPHPVFVTSA